MSHPSHSVLAVGQPSPFPSAGVGAMAIAAVIHGGILTLIVQLPDVSADDMVAITGDPFALSLHQTPANPIGTMMLALRGQGEIRGLGSEYAARRTGGFPVQPDKEAADRGLPMDFLKLVQDGILSCSTFNSGAFMMSSIQFTGQRLDGRRAMAG